MTKLCDTTKVCDKAKVYDEIKTQDMKMAFLDFGASFYLQSGLWSPQCGRQQNELEKFCCMFVEILLDLDHNHVASLSEFLFRWFSVRCIFNKKNYCNLIPSLLLSQNFSAHLSEFCINFSVRTLLYLPQNPVTSWVSVRCILI